MISVRLLLVGGLGVALLGCGEGPQASAAVPSAAAATDSPSATAATGAPPAAGAALPDPRLSPGEAFPGVTAAQVCTSGYSGRVRHVERQQYVDVYSAYGLAYPQSPGAYELDHLIPLELGGDNADANLWPEPASPPPGFHQKDVLENRLHEMVCSGQLALADAQRAIATDWYAAYRTYIGG